MTKLYFEHEKTGKKFAVVRLDKETNQIVLQGDHAQFKETYDKDRFKEMGYVLKKE